MNLFFPQDSLSILFPAEGLLNFFFSGEGPPKNLFLACLHPPPPKSLMVVPLDLLGYVFSVWSWTDLMETDLMETDLVETD